MASLTHKVENVRRAKRTKQGQSRKHANAKGSTPRFPVHVENAPECVLPMPPRTQKDI